MYHLPEPKNDADPELQGGIYMLESECEEVRSPTAVSCVKWEA